MMNGDGEGPRRSPRSMSPLGATVHDWLNTGGIVFFLFLCLRHAGWV